MKAVLPLFFLIVSSLFAQDAGYLEIVKKIKEAGLPDPDYTISSENEAWTPEKLETFLKDAEKKARNKEWTEQEKEFIDRVASAPKKLEFEGNEAEFHPEILAHPQEALNILSSKEVPAEMESVLKSCQESGRFTREFRQTLKVTFASDSKPVKQCDWHQRIEKANVKGESDKKKRKKIADKKVSEIKHKLKTDPAVEKNSISVEIMNDIHKYHIDIIVKFKHMDGCIACDHFHEAAIPDMTTEKDEWTTDDPEDYAHIASSPYCKRILVDEEEADEKEREINGKKIKRDIWSRTVYFQCAPEIGSSPCLELENQGGRLVKKRCIQRNDETGDCEFWEKTYDLGKRTAGHTEVAFEKGKEIWGLNWSEIDPDSMKWDQRSDLPKARAQLKLIADMPLGEGAELYNLDENKPIFNGTVHRCNCNPIGEVWDCCNDMKALWPAECSVEETELREMRGEGRCHKVGSYSEKVPGVKIKYNTVRVYCCYPTKLLRIFNEQARKEMGLGWGKAKAPNCSGFSLEEMDGKIRLDTMDFSAIEDELEVDEVAIKEEMAKKLQEALEDQTLKNFFLKGPDA
jgi:conjugal transfer mating pair stabilization protein TraN